MVYLYKGRLPWTVVSQGSELDVSLIKEVIIKSKLATTVKMLFEGLPYFLKLYMEYVFAHDPVQVIDYEYLGSLFSLNDKLEENIAQGAMLFKKKG